MNAPLHIAEVRFTPASVGDAEQGLLGFVSLVLNEAIRLDSLGLRRTLSGELRLSWPSREDGAGKRHPYSRPITDAARREVERQVFQQLGLAAETEP